MDQHHQQQPIHDDHNSHLQHNPYAYYTQDDEPSYGPGVVYAQHQIPHPHYQVVHTNPNPRHSSADLRQSLQYPSAIGLMPQGPYPPVYVPSPPQEMNLSLDPSPPPQSPSVYDPLSPPISGSDASGEGIYFSRNSSGTGSSSPTSSRGSSLVHRNSLRYNPTPSPSNSSGGRSRGHSLSEDDFQMGTTNFVEGLASQRKEATRRQRIEAEQRRRDELRDGYAKLKDVLPVSNQKSSKVSLLERATNHIMNLELHNRNLQARVQELDSELSRLRALNEKISLAGNAVGDTPSPARSMSMAPLDSRPLSPPPDVSPAPMFTHALTAVGGQQPPREDSDGSENEGGGY